MQQQQQQTEETKDSQVDLFEQKLRRFFVDHGFIEEGSNEPLESLVNKENSYRNAPIFYAKDFTILKFLIKNGADISVKDNCKNDMLLCQLDYHNVLTSMLLLQTSRYADITEGNFMQYNNGDLDEVKLHILHIAIRIRDILSNNVSNEAKEEKFTFKGHNVYILDLKGHKVSTETCMRNLAIKAMLQLFQFEVGEMHKKHSAKFRDNDTSTKVAKIPIEIDLMRSALEEDLNSLPTDNGNYTPEFMQTVLPIFQDTCKKLEGIVYGPSKNNEQIQK